MKNITIEYADGMKIVLPATKTTLDRTLRVIRKKSKTNEIITAFVTQKDLDMQPTSSKALSFNTPEAKKNSPISITYTTNEKP